MSKNLPTPASPQGLPAGFTSLLEDVKARIRTAQTRAGLAVNAEMVRLYWDIGRMIDERQRREGWGAAVIPRLSQELRTKTPGSEGILGTEHRADDRIRPAYPRPASFCHRLWQKCPGGRNCHKLWQNLQHKTILSCGSFPGDTTPFSWKK